MSRLPKFSFILIIYFLLLPLCYAEAKLHFVFKGINGEVLQNTESRLDVLQQSFGQLNPEKIQTIYEQSPQEIRNAMQPYGYFRAQIQSSLLQKNSDWTATFIIQPGHRITITHLDIKVIGRGEKDPKIDKFIRNFPLKVGDVFRTDVYDKAKEGLFQIANSQGYMKAFLSTNQVKIDIDHYQLEVILYLQTGPRYYFGKVYFEENPYAANFLQRFIPFHENEPFSSDKLIQFQQALSTSYYFQQVLVTPDFNDIDNHHVPIKIAVSAPKAKKYNIGIGYGTYTGPRLTAGMSLRRLTDTGQHFDAQFKLSSVLSGLAGKYYIPGNNPLTDQWVVGTNYQRFLPKNGASTSGTLSAGYVRKTTNLQTTADLNYLVERYKVEGLAAEKSQLFYPSLNLAYTKSDDPIHPLFGKSINLTLRGASQAVLSSTNFLQSEIRGKYLFTPVSFAHIILRANLGYTLVNDLKDLPLSMRFFAGGLNTIRGYPDSSIGPGRYLYVGSVEYQNHIKNNWSGAIFYDFGTATDHFGTPINKGAGVGIIYESLIGPVKLYVAQAISKPKKPYSLEFSIGPEF